MEEPISDYTVDELEHWVFRRHCAQAAWTQRQRLRFRKRDVPYPAHYPLLVPGGRWLLSMIVNTASLGVIDLDAAQLVPSILCSAGEDVPSILREGTLAYQALSARNCFTTWIDAAEPRLTFRVAIFPVTQISRHELESQLISSLPNYLSCSYPSKGKIICEETGDPIGRGSRQISQ
jgi:hypothetical protein